MFYGQVEGTGLVVLDPRFHECFAGYVRVERLWTGARWSEGPAWFGAGRYLVWSDIPNNRMMRYDETSGAVSVFRQPSNNSNGNTVDKSGTAGHLRAWRAARQPHRDRRRDHHHRRALEGQAAQFAQRRGGQVRRFDLVHRSQLRHRRRQRGRPGRVRDRRIACLSGRSRQRRGRAGDRQYGEAERSGLLSRRKPALCGRYRGDPCGKRPAPHPPLRGVEERPERQGRRGVRRAPWLECSTVSGSTGAGASGPARARA